METYPFLDTSANGERLAEQVRAQCRYLLADGKRASAMFLADGMNWKERPATLVELTGQPPGRTIGMTVLATVVHNADMMGRELWDLRYEMWADDRDQRLAQLVLTPIQADGNVDLEAIRTHPVLLEAFWSDREADLYWATLDVLAGHAMHYHAAVTMLTEAFIRGGS